jgi:hypothetical protein
VTLQTGQQERIPFAFAAQSGQLKATFHFSTGETQEDTFQIDEMPAPQLDKGPHNIPMRLSLFDPEGETKKLLDALHVDYKMVDATADLTAADTLVIGKHALTLKSAAPDITKVREGLKVILFEQTGAVLEQRLGFRVAEYGLRQVFERVPNHTLLIGLSEENLRDWRGEATTLPPRLTYEKPPLFNNTPTIKWAGIPETRVWRNGNRGNVASALIEKPAQGDFLPVLDGGYSLQYTPLLEHHDGKGLVIFCQLDVTGRTETDPAAELLARNLLQYVGAWKPPLRRSVVYEGGEEGRSYLHSISVPFVNYKGESLAEGNLLIVGPGVTQKLVAAKILALGLPLADLSLFMQVKADAREHISTYFIPFESESPFAGVSPAEVHNRSPRNIALIAEGAAIVGDGVFAETAASKVIFSQLAPWQFPYSSDEMNVKRTFRKVSVMTARLLGNLGVSPPTPLLSHFAHPVNDNEKRWLDGLYLDVPEEWDDPYRFFRW